MSLQRLLAERPEYPARKVRRLACQLHELERVDPTLLPSARSIAHDLTDYHMHCAGLVGGQEIVVEQVETGISIDLFQAKEREAVRAVNLEQAIESLKRLRNNPNDNLMRELIENLNQRSFMAFYEVEDAKPDRSDPGH